MRAIYSKQLCLWITLTALLLLQAEAEELLMSTEQPPEIKDNIKELSLEVEESPGQSPSAEAAVEEEAAIEEEEKQPTVAEEASPDYQNDGSDAEAVTAIPTTEEAAEEPAEKPAEEAAAEPAAEPAAAPAEEPADEPADEPAVEPTLAPVTVAILPPTLPPTKPAMTSAVLTKCYSCSSSDTTSCVKSPVQQKDCAMPQGCYTLVMLEKKQTTRGCLSDLTEEGHRYCKEHSKQCEICFKPGCNKQAMSTAGGAASLGALSFVLVSVAAILATHCGIFL